MNTSENKLRAADILFSNKTKDIRFLSDEFNWKEISDDENRAQFFSRIASFNYPKSLQVFNGEYNLAVPGGIDPHVHFDTPGFEFREDFEHASTAAAFGGVTTIIDMPCTSIPPVSSLKNLRTKLKAVKKRSLIDFSFWGGVPGTAFDNPEKLEKNIFDLANAGVAGFKIYTISGMCEFTDMTYEQIEAAAKIIGRTGKPLAVHAEDKNIVIKRRGRCRSNNMNDWKAYCGARCVRAESQAVKKLINIAEKTGTRIHIVHLSSKAALDKIRQAQKRGIQISTETCPHYLYFTQSDFENEKIRNYLKTAPPVKFEKDKIALWRGLKNESVKFVATDHAGTIPGREKRSENFWEVYGGIPGVEHRVPFLFSEGFLKGRLNLESVIKLISTNAADYFGLPNKGKIISGYDADYALINLGKKNVIRGRKMHSKGKYTPFENVEFGAAVDSTFVRGVKIAGAKNHLTGTIGHGKFIRV